jgi:hypothetical protein
VGKEPNEERKANAEEEAGDNGKIKGAVFTAVDDVAGEAAEAEGKFGTEVENRADEDEEGTEEEERAAEFAKRVHAEDCSERRGSNEVGSQGGQQN